MNAHTRRDALGIGALLATALTACSGDTSAEPTDQPTAASERLPSSGEVDPGTYLAGAPGWTVKDYAMTLPAGWTAAGGLDLKKHPGEPTEVSVQPYVVEEIYADACVGDDDTSGTPVAVGPGPDALIEALRSQKHGPRVSKPVETTLGGQPATRVELTIPRGLDVSGCRVPGAIQIWFQERASSYLAFTKESEPATTLYILDLDGKHQVFVTGAEQQASQADRAEVQQILDSIDFEQ